MVATISALPTPPTRADAANFAARADAFLPALVTFGAEANALADEVNDLAADAATAAAAALNAPGTAATSTSSHSLTTGSKTFSIATGKLFFVGQPIVIARTSAPGTQWMEGRATAAPDGSITVDVQTVTGTGSGITDWTISLSPTVARASVADIRAGTDDGKALTIAALMGALAPVAISYASSWAPNLTAGINFIMTVAGTLTLANPSSIPSSLVGRTGRIRFTRDATVSTGAISYGSYYTFPYKIPPPLPTGAGKKSDFFYEVISTTEILLSPLFDTGA